MIPIGCGCNKNRSTVGGEVGIPGTYRVYQGGRKVYETTSKDAADTVAQRFASAETYAPGVKAPGE